MKHERTPCARVGAAVCLLLLTPASDARAGAAILKRMRPAAAAPAAPLQAATPAPSHVQQPSVAQASSASPAPPPPPAAAVLAQPQWSVEPAVTAEPAEPAAAPRDAGTEPPPNEPDDTPPLEPGVELRASTGVVHRSLRFYQDVYDRLRALDANLAVYRIDAAVYPAFRGGALDGHVALVAGYEGTVAGSVRDDDFGGAYPITHSELYAGLRARRLVQRHVLGFELSVGRLAAGLDDGSSRAGAPDVRYGNIRGALDLGTRLGPVHTTFAAAFRLPLSYGELANDEWFPRVGGYGIDAQLRADYPLSSLVAVEASASLRRFVLEMNSEPEDGGAGISEVAGGAVDSFLALYAGVRLSL